MAKEQAVIRMNPDKTQIEVITPDGVEWGPVDWPADQLVVHSQQGGEAFLTILEGYEGLKANTVYALVEVDTVVEEDEILDSDEADEADEPEDVQPAFTTPA